MATGAEKKDAQPECAKFLNLVGVARKILDVVLCPRCGQEVYPADKGAADYMAVLCSGRGTAIEVKGTYDNRFPFNQIEPEQWTWLANFANRAIEPFFWLQMGEAAVDARSPFARRSYLIPLTRMIEVKHELESRNVSSLPMNAEAAKKPLFLRQLGLHADAWLTDCKLTWRGGGVWWPAPEHPFWTILETPYMEYKKNEITSSRSRNVTQPSLFN